MTNITKVQCLQKIHTKYIQCNALYEDESSLLVLKNELSNTQIQVSVVHHILQKCEKDLQG